MRDLSLVLWFLSNIATVCQVLVDISLPISVFKLEMYASRKYIFVLFLPLFNCTFIMDKLRRELLV